MAVLLVPGRTRRPKPPWYLERSLNCPHCDALFQLEERDFFAGGWRTETVLDSCWTPLFFVVGRCPGCGKEMTVCKG